MATIEEPRDLIHVADLKPLETVVEIDPTPLQAPVAVICDALCVLPTEDRQRALDAARVILGVAPMPVPTPVDEGPIVELLRELLRSMREDQARGLVNSLDLPQRILFSEIITRVGP